jgi:hypothetical protein
MRSDIQVFVLPDKDRIEVHADGRIIHTAQESTEAYATETDISETRLGALLRGVLLEASSKELSLRESKGLPSQERPLNLSTQVLSTQVKLSTESELSASEQTDKTFLRQEVKTQLLSAGIPAEEVEFFGTVSVYVQILNKTRNPVKTAQTFRAKDTYPERFAAWSRRRKNYKAEDSPAEIEGDDSAPDFFLCAKCDSLLPAERVDFTSKSLPFHIKCGGTCQAQIED